MASISDITPMLIRRSNCSLLRAVHRRPSAEYLTLALVSVILVSLRFAVLDDEFINTFCLGVNSPRDRACRSVTRGRVCRGGRRGAPRGVMSSSLAALGS